MNFATANADSLVLTGHLPVNGVFPVGQVMIVDVGGVVKAFVLNGSGHAQLNAQDKLALHIRSALVQPQLTQRNFRLQLGAGSFATALADEQLTAASASNAPRKVNVTIVFLNTVFTASMPQLYTVRGSVGKTKTAR